MARLNSRAIVPQRQREQNISETEEPDQPETSISSTPTESSGSDKENYRHNQAGRKRKSTTFLMSTSRTGDGADAPSSKRSRREATPQHGSPSQVVRRKHLEDQGDTRFYDPEQDEDKKRQTKKKLRDLSSKLNDLRAEYLQPNSRGIQDTLVEADEIYKNVKQTSVATIDSRLLVTVGDLAYRKVNTLTLGDASSGIDVDDFITKCISYMKQGEQSTETQISASQRRQRRRVGLANDEDDEEEVVDLNWSSLGRNVCCLYNSRPRLSGFLLGPLSVQKKVRQQSQRKATQRRTANDAQVVRPVELDEDDLDAQESANLTVVCAEIARLLGRTQEMGEKEVEQEVEGLDGDDLDEDQIRGIMRKHGISDNGGVPLFDFCVNPKSFGQTVENFFYVSFLIKEGKVGLDFDSNGLPTLGMAEEKTVRERQETQRNQAVFTLDFDMWEELIESYGLERSIIPHREEQDWDDGTLPSHERGSATVEAEDMYGPS